MKLVAAVPVAEVGVLAPVAFAVAVVVVAVYSVFMIGRFLRHLR